MEVGRKALRFGDGTKKDLVVFDAVPEYAISYLYYGDKDGLSDEDVKIIDKWMADNNLDEVVDSGEERFFSSRPEFGLPTTCVKMSFLERSRAVQEQESKKKQKPEKKQESVVERDSGGMEY